MPVRPVRSGGAALLLAAALSAPAAASDADSTDPAAAVAGLWMTGKRTAAVELYACGAALCGRIAWMADPFGPDGDLKRDRDNPDPALRERPWCGIEVISGLERDGPDAWDGGAFYYPKHGRTYRLALERQGERLRLRAYLGVKLLGRTETWERAGPEIGGCPPAG